MLDASRPANAVLLPCGPNGITLECGACGWSAGCSGEVTHVCQQAVPAGGVGSELKAILEALWITPASGCQCQANALTMDQKGPEWVRNNTETVLGWLRSAARKRGLPFFDAIGLVLIKQSLAAYEAKMSRSDSTLT